MFKKISIQALLLVLAIGMGAQDDLAWSDGMFEDEEFSTESVVAPPPPLIEAAPAIEVVEAEIAEAEETVQSGPDFWGAISKGMILMTPRADGEIAASVDAKQMLGQGDIVYLSSYDTLFSPGQESLIFKTLKPVHHPKTGVLMGDMVEILGVVKIKEVGAEVSTAEILRSRNPIYKKDKIAPIDQFMPPPPPSLVFPKEGAEGTIVAVPENRLRNAQHDIVYIDHGSEEGIIPGDRFVIIHGGERISVSAKTTGEGMTDDVRIPYREVGTLVVLATQMHTATGKIVSSVEEILTGDSILYLSQQQAALK